MPDALSEIGQEFPDEGINALDFECFKCRTINAIPVNVLKDVVTEAEATAIFLVYQKRFRLPMYQEEEIPLIANAAKSYLIAKKALYKRL